MQRLAQPAGVLDLRLVRAFLIVAGIMVVLVFAFAVIGPLFTFGD